MTITSDLFALQEIDAAIDAAMHELETVRERLADETALTEARAAAAEQEARRHAAEGRARDLEREIADVQAKMSPVERKLYDGSVRNPKELQSFQDELDMYRQQQRVIEDQQLQVMEHLEASAAALQAARAALADAERSRATEQGEMGTRARDLTRRQEQLQEQRRQRTARIDPARLALYDRLRKARAGRAVVRIERGTCQGCRITLPTTIQQRARSGLQIVQCTSCDRILYAG